MWKCGWGTSGLPFSPSLFICRVHVHVTCVGLLHAARCLGVHMCICAYAGQRVALVVFLNRVSCWTQGLPIWLVWLTNFAQNFGLYLRNSEITSWLPYMRDFYVSPGDLNLAFWEVLPKGSFLENAQCDSKIESTTHAHTPLCTYIHNHVDIFILYLSLNYLFN